MADEIAQVASLELEGVKILLKGSIQVISWSAQFMKGLFNGTKDLINDKLIHEHSAQDIIKMSKDGNPITINVNQDVLKDVLERAKKQGLNYSKLPDPNPNDNYIPLFIPPQEAAFWQAIVKTCQANSLAKCEERIQNYNDEIADNKEKILHLTGDDVEVLTTRNENLEQAKTELVLLIEDKKNVIENGLKEYSLEEYLGTFKGTRFELDPEKALAEYFKGVNVGVPVTAVEFLQPVRDISMVPESKIQYIVPNVGETITREFKEKDGLAYSNYDFKSSSGEMYSFSDLGVTKDEWNMEQLPDILQKAGIPENIPCYIMASDKLYDAFKQYYNKVPLLSETKNIVDGKTLGFSSEEVKSQIQSAVSDMAKGISSKTDNIKDVVNITVPADSIHMENGKLLFSPNGLDGKQYEIPSVSAGELIDDKFNISFAKDAVCKVFDKGNEGLKISATAVKNIADNMMEKAAEGIKQNLGR